MTKKTDGKNDEKRKNARKKAKAASIALKRPSYEEKLRDKLQMEYA